MSSTNDNGDLLNRAINCHGGFEQWNSIEKITIHARTGGMALPLRFKFNKLRNYEAQIYVNEPQVIITPHPVKGRKGIFLGNKVWIESDDGRVMAERDHARRAFKDFRHKIWWDNLDVMHFAGYALWNYMTSPFLLRREGFQTRELGPWEENGETWHRLKAIFPANILTHSTEQIFYFDSEGLLRRLDYTAEVFGNFARACHYCRDHKMFDGIMIPTRRQVFPRKKDGSPNRSITLVRIDIQDVVLDKAC
jgi:hypothetical protein